MSKAGLLLRQAPIQHHVNDLTPLQQAVQVTLGAAAGTLQNSTHLQCQVKSRITAAALFASSLWLPLPLLLAVTHHVPSLACISHQLWLLQLVLQHTDSCACLACCHVPVSLSCVV